MLLVLGGLTALPPLSFDMYLPALPDIAADFGVPESQIQLTLSSCLIGIALGQLFGGPLSDTLGRRRPLVVGLVGYTVFCFACAAAPSAPALIALRFFMGLFGGVAVVISRAVVRDRATGAEAARIFSLLMLVSGAAPIVAPLIGGLLIDFTSWRGIFVVLGGLGLAGLAAALAVLPETLHADQRRSGGVRDTISVVGHLVRDRTFMGYALTSGFAFGVLFFYISSSSFVFQEIYGLSPQGFSAVFAGNAVGLVAFGQLNAILVRRYAPTSLLRWGTV
jgi:DHA1 family bicyclomycin/chloramphenicol resistance-like MFS transporter